jgi:hypothetical protein
MSLSYFKNIKLSNYMKKIYTSTLSLIFALCISSAALAQNVLYSNDFTGGSAGWSLSQANNFDLWVVNNTYNCVTPTPDQGGGNYLHVANDLEPAYCAFAGYLGLGSSGTSYATMTSGINTTGAGAVTLSFDWLCVGQAGMLLASYGTLEYSTNSGSTWTAISSPVSQYVSQSTWTTATVSSQQVPAFLNQSDLRFRFAFVNSGYGTNPSFAVDNIEVTDNLPTGIQLSTNEESIHLTWLSHEKNLWVNCKDICPESISIIDMIGREVYAVQSGNKQQQIIHFDSFAPGVYIFRGSKGSQVISKKILLTE